MAGVVSNNGDAISDVVVCVGDGWVTRYNQFERYLVQYWGMIDVINKELTYSPKGSLRKWNKMIKVINEGC